MAQLKDLFVMGDSRVVGDTYNNSPKIAYGTCTTAAGTAAKVVVIADPTWNLQTGNIIGVKFSNTNSASNVTLNVNDSGAKSLYFNTGVYTGTGSIVTGYANNIIYYMYDGTNWVWLNCNWDTNKDTFTSAYSSTGAGTAAKTASMNYYTATPNSYVHINFRYANTSASAITLNIDGKGAYPIYINGTASSATNYTLPAGPYIAYFDGTNYYFRTDGKLGGTTGVYASVYSGATAPTASLGANGDIYIQIS